MNHRTDPRTMEDRWRAMGYDVEWSDAVRGYIVEPAGHLVRSSLDFRGVVRRTVDEVEAYVSAHAEVEL